MGRKKLTEEQKETIRKIREERQASGKAYFRYVAKSGNTKTGTFSQTYTTDNTCPHKCGKCTCKCCDFCYAKNPPTWYQWNNTWHEGIPLEELQRKIHKDGGTEIIRHNIAGDVAVPGESRIDVRIINTLRKIAREEHKIIFSYTHCEKTEETYNIVKDAVQDNVIFNISCNNLEEVEDAVKHGCNVALSVGHMHKVAEKINGIVYRLCPNMAGEKTKDGKVVQCEDCGMCWRKNRKFVVVFLIHGVKANKAIREDKNIIDI